MRAGVSRAAWVNQRQAEREQARPASWIEQRIAEYAEMARTEGATIQQDHEGNRVGGIEALADGLRPEGQRKTKEVKVYGAEAFGALLEDAGIAIVSNFAGRADKKVIIERTEISFDRGELTKIVTETIKCERG